MPIEAPGRTFAFGPFGSGDKAIVPSVGGERAGAGDGDQNGDDGNVDNMTSGSNINSSQVEATWLAEESQPMHDS